MPFQNFVGVQPAPAVEGDFCDANPRQSAIAGPGAFVAGMSLFVGRFAWASPPNDADNAPAVLNSYGTGMPQGFLHREQQGIFTQYLQEATLQLAPGFAVGGLFSAGNFWVRNNGTSPSIIGQKAYANFATGLANFAAPGNPTGGASGSASTIAAGTSSFTGSIAGNTLTVSGAVTGVIYPGTTISGAGVATGTTILGQISGTTGGDGAYFVSALPQTVASTTISGTYGLLTIGGTVVPGFAVNQVLLTTGAVVANTTITALGTGTGGAGTYVVNNNTVVSSQAISVGAVNVETLWYAISASASGELVKMSQQRQGF
jgi:hypothetical protein